MCDVDFGVDVWSVKKVIGFLCRCYRGGFFLFSLVERCIGKTE